MKKNVGKLFVLTIMLCMSHGAYAQFDGGNDYADEWTLDLGDEEEENKPQHKEYKNFAFLQFSPSQYRFDGGGKLHFVEYSIGYAHSFQVLEEKPYFVEVGASMKYSHSGNDNGYDLLSFRVPANVVYKFYLSKTKDIALAPYAGPSFRAIVAGRKNCWDACQLGWQAGLKFYVNRFFIGVAYSRDFPDDTKYPRIHESSINFGVCF